MLRGPLSGATDALRARGVHRVSACLAALPRACASRGTSGAKLPASVTTAALDAAAAHVLANAAAPRGEAEEGAGPDPWAWPFSLPLGVLSDMWDPLVPPVGSYRTT